MNTIDSIKENAIKWAKEVGKIQLYYFRNPQLEMEIKSNINDVVTIADKACEEFLVKEISKTYPDHTVLGEESGMHEGSSAYRWVVDPIDGTTNYSQGMPVFCVSIAVQYNQETILGVVFAPYLNELYVAAKGQGATLNGNPIHVAQKTELNTCVVTTGFPYDKHINPNNNLKQVNTVLPLVRGMRRMGSAAWDLCSLAAGFIDGYWEMNLNLWDVAAATLIVQEAGGVVLPYQENRNISIVGGNQTIAQQLKTLITNA